MTTFTVAIVLAGIGLYVGLQAASWRRAAVAAQLQLVRNGTVVAGPGRRRRGLQRAGTTLVHALASGSARMQRGGSRSELRRRLYMAGVDINPEVFLAAKSGLAAVALVGLGVAGLRGNMQALLLAPSTAFAIFVLPDAMLTMRQRSRRFQIDRQLPDTMDLLTVSVEAGLGFDAAVQKVTERMEGPLADEFAVMLREMRLGATRRQALRNIADRTGSDDIATFVRSLLQSDELGVPIGRALRVQSEDLRARRQIAAEEQATKAPVKLLFPTVIFIFPVIFMVIVAPALMTLGDVLG